jgi:hypothetical protein
LFQVIGSDLSRSEIASTNDANYASTNLDKDIEDQISSGFLVCENENEACEVGPGDGSRVPSPEVFSNVLEKVSDCIVELDEQAISNPSPDTSDSTTPNIIRENDDHPDDHCDTATGSSSSSSSSSSSLPIYECFCESCEKVHVINRTTALSPFNKQCDWKLDNVPSDGDCFYTCVEEAMSNADINLTTLSVSDQRHAVANSITEDVFKSYKMIALAK